MFDGQKNSNIILKFALITVFGLFALTILFDIIDLNNERNLSGTYCIEEPIKYKGLYYCDGNKLLCSVENNYCQIIDGVE